MKACLPIPAVPTRDTRNRYVRLSYLAHTTVYQEFERRRAASTQRLLGAIDEICIDHMTLGGMRAAHIFACIKHFPGFDVEAVRAYMRECGFDGWVDAPEIALTAELADVVVCNGCNGCTASPYCGTVSFAIPGVAIDPAHTRGEDWDAVGV